MCSVWSEHWQANFPLLQPLKWWFSNRSCEHPQHCRFSVSPSSLTPDSTHQLISRDSKTWNGRVRYERPINVQCWGCSQDWLKNHCSKAMLAALLRNFLKPASAPDAQYQGLTSLINPCEACSEWNLSSTILGSSTITPSASVRNLGVIFEDLQRAHCKDCSILQVCTTQHQKDQTLSDRACCTTSCPGPWHF